MEAAARQVLNARSVRIFGVGASALVGEDLYNKLLGDAQKMLADDAVLDWLYQPQWLTVANKNVTGLWKDMPIFVNDLSALGWS